MSFIDNILDKMGLGDEEYYDDEFLDEEEELDEDTEDGAAKAKKTRGGAKKTASSDTDASFYDDLDDDAADKKSFSRGRTARQTASSKVTSINNNKPAGKKGTAMPGNGMEVCVIKPTSVEDAREITVTLLAGKTVVLNLEGLDIELAQRIIDFTSGSCFAMSGNLQKISSYIFIITPQDVDIFGDFQDILNGTINVSTLRGDL